MKGSFDFTFFKGHKHCKETWEKKTVLPCQLYLFFYLLALTLFLFSLQFHIQFRFYLLLLIDYLNAVNVDFFNFCFVLEQIYTSMVGKINFRCDLHFYVFIYLISFAFPVLGAAYIEHAPHIINLSI